MICLSLTIACLKWKIMACWRHKWCLNMNSLFKFLLEHLEGWDGKKSSSSFRFVYFSFFFNMMPNVELLSYITYKDHQCCKRFQWSQIFSFEEEHAYYFTEYTKSLWHIIKGLLVKSIVTRLLVRILAMLIFELKHYEGNIEYTLLKRFSWNTLYLSFDVVFMN